MRGELRRAREMASAFLQDAEDAGHVVEASVARRGLAIITYNLGQFTEAQTHCERALAARGPERDREARERFSEDSGLIAMSWLGVTMWQLGEVDRARELIEMANRRAAEIGHVPSMAHPLQAKFYLEFLRGDAAAALAAAEALEILGREHGMPHWRAAAKSHVGWARSRLPGPAAGAAELRAEAHRRKRPGDGERRLVLGDAACGARVPGRARIDSALTRIDEALALVRRAERLCDLPFAHLLRGEVLLKRDPADPVTAEEAFQTAIGIAKEQGARGLGDCARRWRSPGYFSRRVDPSKRT